jgi:2-polyprenyl-3-methyl-5-hydroxy-6-metoxy-1,4-benzoquinol methylase
MAAAKPSGYYSQGRPELVDLLPAPSGRVLDVGCGEGAVGRLLLERGAAAVVGVEVHEPAARAAAGVYEQVLALPVEEALGRLEPAFDTILLYDVLEHLADPVPVLRGLLALAAPGATLHVSVPNARHWTLVRDLVLRGTFGYADAGHRDATHLRWLTRRDLVALLEATGWSVERVAHTPLRRLSAVAERLTRGLTAEFLVYQWSALARAPRSATAGGP